MANTRDTLGDQATVDGLVNRTLTSLEEDGVVTLGGYALYNNTALTSVTLPGVNTINQYAMSGCTNLETVNLSGTGTKTINNYAFQNCNKLQHLLINSTSMSTLSATNAFTNTPIARKDGAIYVPSNVISDYKANTNWKNYFITDINNYPLSNFESISDSWDTILANENYATDYSIGDTKTIDLGTEGTHLMVLVAIDTDIKSDNSGTARMTWISNTLLATTHRWNPSLSGDSGARTEGTGTIGGWEKSELRTYLRETIYPLIPSNIRSKIVAVNKISTIYNTDETKTTDSTSVETVWIPSNYEVGFTGYETTGVIYNTYFNSNISRVKYNTSGTATYWWLRSASSTSNARNVYNGGSYGSSDVTYTYGVALGFCV